MNLPQLTVTRFWAAMAIVFFHLGHSVWPLNGYPGWVALLDFAVTYFFALSGFILVISQVRKGELPTAIDPGRFYRNRFARIYPLYLFALLLWLVFTFANQKTRSFVKVDEVFLSLTLMQTWFKGYALTCNLPGWSLSVEAFFYALFPLLYWVWRRWPTAWVLTSGLAIWMLCMGSTVLCWMYSVNYLTLMFYPLWHLGSFALGMAVGFGFVRHHAAWLPYRWWFRGLGVVLMALCLNFLSTESFSIFVILGHNGGLSPLYLLLIVGLALTTQKRPLLARGIQPWLGEISYGIYILHLPVSSHTYRISAWISQYIPIDPFWFRAGILITVSAILYKFVEVPAREFLRGKKTPSRVIGNPEVAPVSS